MDIDSILDNDGTIYGGYLRDNLVGDIPRKIDISLPNITEYTSNEYHPLGQLRDGILSRMDSYYEISDFTCNLLQRDKYGLHLRYIPDCFEYIKDPFGEVLEHIQNKHICFCCSYVTSDEALILLDRMEYLIRRGWRTSPTWHGLHVLDSETVCTACDHVIPLRSLKKHFNISVGQATCPVCYSNPLVKEYLPFDIYNGSS